MGGMVTVLEHFFRLVRENVWESRFHVELGFLIAHFIYFGKENIN